MIQVPLLGSEKFDFPAIINSKEFKTHQDRSQLIFGASR